MWCTLYSVYHDNKHNTLWINYIYVYLYKKTKQLFKVNTLKKLNVIKYIYIFIV